VPVEPGHGMGPVPVHRAQGDAQSRRGLFGHEPCEVARCRLHFPAPRQRRRDSPRSAHTDLFHAANDAVISQSAGTIRSGPRLRWSTATARDHHGNRLPVPFHRHRQHPVPSVRHDRHRPQPSDRAAAVRGPAARGDRLARSRSRTCRHSPARRSTRRHCWISNSCRCI
jgi:hypothetical protein